MKKLLIIFLLLIQCNLTMAQLDELYYFDHYYNPTLYASNQIKTCKIYKETLTDSIPQKILVGEQRFDLDGKLRYYREYYTADTLAGILRSYYYDSLGRVTETYWTWIEDEQTDQYTYTYNKNGLLGKYVMHTKDTSNPTYKRVETKKLFYNKQNTLLYIKTRPRITTSVWYKRTTYYQYKNDTTFARDNTNDYYYAYVNGLQVEHYFAGFVHTYEYDDMQHLVKLTVMGPWDVSETEEYSYENGLIISSDKMIYLSDGNVQKRWTYVYERY